MPTLNQIQCSIELGTDNIKLKEYGTKYTDSAVETFIPVPNAKVAFTVHVEQQKYLAPGLAAFVFVDGVYYANRNKMGLKVPGAGISKSETVAEFRFRQKEEKDTDGQFIGREWHFADLKTANADKAAHVNPQYYKNVGTIEVVILRASGLQDQAPPPKSNVASEEQRKQTAKPVAAVSIKKSASASAGGSFFGGMAGLFDGAADERDCLDESKLLSLYDDGADGQSDDSEQQAIYSLDGAGDEPPPRSVHSRRTNAQPPPGQIYDPVDGKFISLHEAVKQGDIPLEHQFLRVKLAMEYLNAENAKGHVIPGLQELLTTAQATMGQKAAVPKEPADVWESADPTAKPPPGYLLDPVSGKYISIPAALRKGVVTVEQQAARSDAVVKHLDELEAAGLLIPDDMLPALLAASKSKPTPEGANPAGNEHQGKGPAENAQIDGADQRPIVNNVYTTKSAAAPHANDAPGLPRLQSLPEAFIIEGPDGAPVKMQPYQVLPTLATTKEHLAELEQRYFDIKDGKILRDLTDAQASAEMHQLYEQAVVARAVFDRVQAIWVQVQEYMSAHGITELPRPGFRQVGEGTVGGGQGRGPLIRGAVKDYAPQLNAIPENGHYANQAMPGAWGSPDTPAANGWNKLDGNSVQQAQNGGWADANNSKPASQHSRRAATNAWVNQNSGSNGGNDAAGGWGRSDGNMKSQSAGGWDNYGNDRKEKTSIAWGATGDKHHSSKPRESPKAKGQISQSDGLTASSPPSGQPKPYWMSWQQAPPALDSSSSAAVVKRPTGRSPYQYAEVKMPAVPENKVSKDVKYGVQAGKGVKYSHEIARPVYIDSMASPFAVFSFKYRSVDVLKKLVKDDVVADMKKLTAKVEEADLRSLPRDELIARMMKLKTSGGSKPDNGPARGSSESKASSARNSEKPLHRSDGWSEASKGRSTRGDAWKEQTSHKSAQDAWVQSQRSASDKGGNGGWAQSQHGGKSKATSAQGGNNAAQNNNNTNQGGWDATPANVVGWDGHNEQAAEAVKAPTDKMQNAWDATTPKGSNLVQMPNGAWMTQEQALKDLDKMEEQSRMAAEKRKTAGSIQKEGDRKSVGASLVSHAFKGNQAFVTGGGQVGRAGAHSDMNPVKMKFAPTMVTHEATARSLMGQEAYDLIKAQHGRAYAMAQAGKVKGDDLPAAKVPYHFEAESDPMAKYREGGKVPSGPAGW
ncbi:hypothetical protein LTR86_005459 [Recurvomyces mirabilis]|nr:hypothetical protein LTR86_005459 [Recurvomyces mirabilis]